MISGLARLVRDVSLAEELAQDALVAALEQWPASGVPPESGRLVDDHREEPRAQCAAALQALARRPGKRSRRSCKPTRRSPSWRRRSRRAWTSRSATTCFGCCSRPVTRYCRRRPGWRSRCGMVAGLTTAEIARAFLTAEATMAQRVVRAKRTLGEAHVPFEVPQRGGPGPRLSSVLEVVYLIFNEGYSATAGEDLMRPALMDEALRLGGLVSTLAPDEPEAHGLLALMGLQSSRAAARMDAAGEPVLLTDQDRCAVGSGGHRLGAGCAGPRRGADRSAGPVSTPGGDRGVSRPGLDRGADELGAHRAALWRAGQPRALTGDRAQPRGGRLPR